MYADHLMPIAVRIASPIGLAVVIGATAFWAGLRYHWRRCRPRRDFPSCPRCGYDVHTLIGSACPECGADLPTVGFVRPEQTLPLPRGRSRLAWAIWLWTAAVVGTAAGVRWERIPAPHEVSGEIPLLSPRSGKYAAAGISFVTEPGFRAVPPYRQHFVGVGCDAPTRALAHWELQAGPPFPRAYVSSWKGDVRGRTVEVSSVPARATVDELFRRCDLDPADPAVAEEAQEICTLWERVWRLPQTGDGSEWERLAWGNGVPANFDPQYRPALRRRDVYPFWYAPLFLAAWAGVWLVGDRRIRRRTRWLKAALGAAPPTDGARWRLRWLWISLGWTAVVMGVWFYALEPWAVPPLVPLVLFPFATLGAALGVIGLPMALVLMAVQYPAYGVALSAAETRHAAGVRGAFTRMAAAVAGFHVLGIVLAIAPWVFG